MEERLWKLAREATDYYNAAFMTPWSTPEERARLRGRKEAYVAVLATATGRSIEDLEDELGG